MRKKKRYIAWVYVIAAGWFLAVAHAKGESLAITQPNTEASRYRTPEDLLDKVPFLGNIPKTFLLGDGYTMKLSGTKLRIDHHGRASRSKGEKRACMVGLSYTAPVAFFTTRIDLPLFTSPTLAMHEWQRSSMGDYVLYMSRLPVKSPSLTLSISAKF